MSSGCGDVLSLEDLKTAKKHQTFEAEVITGKAGGVAGGADIDFATNQVTGQVQKTLPAVLRDVGFEPAAFDFTTGGTLTVEDRNKVVYDPASMTWYSWGGTLPKVIPAGTDPTADANWEPQNDPTLRSDLASPTGYTLIPSLSTWLPPELETNLNPNNQAFNYLSTIVNNNKSPKDNIRSLQQKTGPTRFATWNLWTEYTTDNFFGNDRQSPEKTMLLQEQFLDAQVDYFGFQETYINPAIRTNYLAVPPLNYAFFGQSEDFGGGQRYGNMTLTRFDITDHYVKIYNDATPTALDAQKRSYIRERIASSGVTVYTTHLSTDPTRASNMLSEFLSEVTTNGGSKVVLMGDFNTADVSAFAGFEAAGFTIVNKDAWGTSIDRILVKGLTIVSFGRVVITGHSSKLSDHDMFYVDVQ